MDKNLGTKIGEVDHFFDRISVAALKLTGDLKIGDTIRIKGATTDFTQTVSGMQSEHVDLIAATTGQEIGLKVSERVREGDGVFVI